MTQYTNIFRPRSTRDLSLVRNLANQRTSSMEDAVFNTKASAAWARKRAASSRIVFQRPGGPVVLGPFFSEKASRRRAPGTRRCPSVFCSVCRATSAHGKKNVMLIFCLALLVLNRDSPLVVRRARVTGALLLDQDSRRTAWWLARWLRFARSTRLLDSRAANPLRQFDQSTFQLPHLSAHQV